MENIKLIGESLHQWDTGRKIEISAAEGITIDEVHFALKYDMVALVTKPMMSEEKLVADIPDILLQRAGTLMIWTVMRYPDGSERTITTTKEPIKNRAKPEGYVYTKTDALNYRSLEERIKQIEQNGVGGGASASYDSETGELLIKSSAVGFDEQTGELTI